MVRIKKPVSALRNSRPIIANLVSNGQSAASLSDVQRNALCRFKEYVKNGEYSEILHPCVCKKTDDVLIACKDRYGIPVKTVLCKNCGLMRSDPYLSPDALEKFYRNDYRPIYERSSFPVASVFAREIINGEYIYRFLEEHNIVIPRYLFAVGCGAGGSLVPFLLKKHIVWGCDYAPNFLEMGCKLGLDLHEGGLKALRDELPHSLIVLCHVLEHFWDPVSNLIALGKKMQPKSLVYIELPGIYSMHKDYENPLMFFQNAHAYHFCLQTLNYVMSLTGFEQVCGNEKIQAVYYFNPSVKSVIHDPAVYKNVLRYLRDVNYILQLRRIPVIGKNVKLIHKLINTHFPWTNQKNDKKKRAV